MRRNKFALGVLLVALILAGVTSLFLAHTSAQQMRVIALAQGWNLVTWTGEKQSASQALTSVSDAVSAVYGYDNDSQTFTRYFIDRPEISTLTDFEPEEAYWVLAQRSATWWVPGVACPDCSLWQSAAEQCLADYEEAASALTECVALLATCNAAPPPVIDQQDLDEVCGLIDDLVSDSQNLQGAWGLLLVKIMFDDDFWVSDWSPTDFAVGDVNGAAFSLQMWATWNCR